MSRSAFSRRAMLIGGGHAALLSALPTTTVAAARFSEDPFSMGVASGDPLPDGFVIWTRLAPRPLDPHGGMPATAVLVDWEIAADEGFRKIVQAGSEVARPELAHSVHVEISGLRSARRYWYRFRVDGIHSDAGTARTAPAPGAEVDRLRIAVAGCQNYQAGLFTAWRHISHEADLDFVYHYGDYIYEGRAAAPPAPGKPPVVRRHLGDELYSLDDYRQRYALYKIDPDLRAAHAAVAFLPSYDDHEVVNNWAAGWDDDHTPIEVFALRRAAAMQAWYEHMPVRRAQLPQGAVQLMYRRLDFGRLLRMHILDKRSYRSIRLCEKPGDGNCVDTRAPQSTPDTMLGSEQERWLAEGLQHDRVWNMFGLGGLVMPFDRSAQKVLTRGTDNWTGYPDARARLVATIQARELRNVVITGGDSHMFFIGNLPSRRDDLESAPVAAELHGTSISSNSSNGSPIGSDPRLATNPHMSMIHDQRGYLLFDIDARLWSASVRVIDQALSPGGTVSTLARYVVRPDLPGAIRA